MLKSEFLLESRNRGFIYQCSDLEALDQLLCEGPCTAYCGFDATAKSLHVGNLTLIMWLKLFQDTGNIPIVLLGGATTKIGDPSGKDLQRKILNDSEIEANLIGIAKVFKKYLRFDDSPTSAKIVNNNDWLSHLNYIDLLKTVGSLFSINKMLSFDNVKSRLDKNLPLSFLEFNYMILQSYDFNHLLKTYNCRLQLGGSDQWGNIVCGIDLVKKLQKQEVYGLTAPLITNSSGQKMGKSVDGALWLDAELLSPYDYWQFWRNTSDNDVWKYLKLFTNLSRARIKELETLEGSKINEAKIILANVATTLAHGNECLESIHKATSTLFGDASNLDACPSIYIDRSPLRFDELFVFSGLVSSKGEFKRLVEARGLKQNDEVIVDPQLICENFPVKLSLGKKKHVVCKLSK